MQPFLVYSKDRKNSGLVQISNALTTTMIFTYLIIEARNESVTLINPFLENLSNPQTKLLIRITVGLLTISASARTKAKTNSTTVIHS